VEISEELAERQRLLGNCIAKLKNGEREVLRMRYEEGGSVDNIAVAVDRSVGSIYNTLSHIRKFLIKCVDQTIRLGGQYEL